MAWTGRDGAVSVALHGALRAVGIGDPFHCP
jgi:hypothetical protein